MIGFEKNKGRKITYQLEFENE